jgi:hypothetical protein
MDTITAKDGNTVKHFDMQPSKEVKEVEAPVIASVEKKVEEPIKPVVKETKTETIVDKAKIEPEKIVEDKTKIDKDKKVETKTDDDKFKVTFASQKVEEPIKKVDTQKQETVVPTREAVLNYLKSEGLEVSEFSELSKKEVLSEAVTGFKKFEEETGRGVNDYLNSMKDWGKESKEDTIREFYKYQPDISDDDIEEHLNLLTVTEDDEDELDDRELRSRKLKFNQTYQEALRFMNGKTKEFKTADKTVQNQNKPMTAEETTKAYQPYWNERDKSLGDLNEVSLSIEGLGDIKVPVSAEHKALISEVTQTRESFFDRWVDDKGVIDTKRTTEDTMWSIPEVRQNLISEMLSQAHALTLENFSKENRNVNLDKVKQKTELAPSGASLQVLGDNKSVEEQRVGKPLF